MLLARRPAARLYASRRRTTARAATMPGRRSLGTRAAAPDQHECSCSTGGVKTCRGVDVTHDCSCKQLSGGIWPSSTCTAACLAPRRRARALCGPSGAPVLPGTAAPSAGRAAGRRRLARRRRLRERRRRRERAPPRARRAAPARARRGAAPEPCGSRPSDPSVVPDATRTTTSPWTTTTTSPRLRNTKQGIYSMRPSSPSAASFSRICAIYSATRTPCGPCPRPFRRRGAIVLWRRPIKGPSAF